MNKKLEKLVKQSGLAPFYSKVIDKTNKITQTNTTEALFQLAPFIRKFASTFVNYYGLKKTPPLNPLSKAENRLDEFYSDLLEQVLKIGLEETIRWLLVQKIDTQQNFFPPYPAGRFYQNIIRGLNLINELIKITGPLDGIAHIDLERYATEILQPAIDPVFEKEGKQLLDVLLSFDVRIEESASTRILEISGQISQLKGSINKRLMSNNTYLSIVQQIAEINKALKTVFKKSFRQIFRNDEEQLMGFWNDLQSYGYVGGENYVNGDYEENQATIEKWLTKEFREETQAILDVLRKAHFTKELPTLDKENMPEALELYTINLLGAIGLRTDTSIKVLLGYHSRFVSKTIREGAYHNLRQNKLAVQEYFFRILKKEVDYDQKLAIAEKHDSIFEKVLPSALVSILGNQFRAVLQQLDTIIGVDGIWLSDFLKSAFFKMPQERHLKSDVADQTPLQVQYYQTTNRKLSDFKSFVNDGVPSVFQKLLNIWGLNYMLSWSLADYQKEERLFSFVFKAANLHQSFGLTVKDASLPLNKILTLLIKEPDARQLIEKLMTLLLNSKISFDFPLFRSLLRIVSQRNLQIQGGVNIRDGFSEQRGYTDGSQVMGKEQLNPILSDPYIFHPIVIFLITILQMKSINIPKDAFVETDISLYLNSLAGMQQSPELGYQLFLANKLISSIPYIVDFGSQHEGVIRKTIADLDEHYERRNVLIHYHRIKIHRAPSKLDLDFCLEILEGLSNKTLDEVLYNLTRLMKGIGDEAIPDLSDFFSLNSDSLNTLGRHLRALKSEYSDVPWTEISENTLFRLKVINLPDIDEDSVRIITTLTKLASALSSYWSQRLSDEFITNVFTESQQDTLRIGEIGAKLAIVRQKRNQFQKIVRKSNPNLEPYQHIFLKRHVIQCDWNFDFFGFWPFYSETKFEAYNIDQKLAILERQLLQQVQVTLSELPPSMDTVSEKILELLRKNINHLILIMVNLVDEGLAPSRFFMDTIHIFQKDQLTISQLRDIIDILLYRELTHIDSFIANTFGHFPEQITRALGRENLDYGLEKLSATDDELLFPLVQETVVGNIMANAHPIPLLEEHLQYLRSVTADLTAIAPSQKIFPPRPFRDLSPVTFGYKAYALITMTKDGFNVPALETLTIDFFAENTDLLNKTNLTDLKSVLIDRILKLEEKTGKHFSFQNCKLSNQQTAQIENTRNASSVTVDRRSPLLVSARSGSYRSMPGILGTVIYIGYDDVRQNLKTVKNPALIFSNYRMFLSTFGNVVFGIRETEFSDILVRHEQELALFHQRQVPLENLGADQMIGIIDDFRKLIESTNSSWPKEDQINIHWNDPLDLLAHSTIGVWDSWDSEGAVNLRDFLGISDDWKTPVTLMEMKLADKNPESFSAILFSGDPQGKVNRPHGDLLFGRPGEDIAAGLVSTSTSLESLEGENPKLYGQIADLMEKIKQNKGNIDVDVELVGEYHPETDHMEIFVIQERQMPLGTRAESEDFRLQMTDQKPLATGQGVNGGVQYGVFLDGVNCTYHQLNKKVSLVRKKLGGKDEFHGPGIFLLMEYVTPEEALKMNIPGVDGMISTKIGKSSHASISAKRDGKLFVCETDVRQINSKWQAGDRFIRLGDHEDWDTFTVIANPKSISPYSGNIYDGIMPLEKIEDKRRQR